MTNQEAKTLTRESIRIALIQLMQTQSIEDITVTALLERAGVSRAGFYRNYTSKEAVLEEIMETFYEKLSIHFIHQLKTTDSETRYIALFQYIKNQSDFMDKFLSIKQRNNHLIFSNPYVEHHYAHLPMTKQYCVHALWRGVREIAIRWAENGMKESPEEMGRLVANLFNFDMIPLD